MRVDQRALNAHRPVTSLLCHNGQRDSGFWYKYKQEQSSVL